MYRVDRRNFNVGDPILPPENSYQDNTGFNEAIERILTEEKPEGKIADRKSGLFILPELSDAIRYSKAQSAITDVTNMKTGPKITLEEEIRLATERINARTKEFESKSKELDSKISLYTNWAWGFVWTGIVVCFIGVYFYHERKPSEFNLNLLGDFLGGSVASVWSLAGLFFIYVAFLGQKQQLLNQQLEIMYSQLEVKYTRLELEGQKNEMIK